MVLQKRKIPSVFSWVKADKASKGRQRIGSKLLKPLGVALVSGTLALSISLPAPMAQAEPLGAYKADGTATLPKTIPSLDAWKASGGTWTLAEDARVVSTQALNARAKALSTELSAYLGSPVPAKIGKRTSEFDVQLLQNSTRKDLGEEGFELKIGSSGVQIIGATDAGVFYGTRSFSQLMRQKQLTLPAGSVVSVPKYKERGVTLCACQLNISTEWIERFLDDVADLHINNIVLEMKLKSDAYPDTQTWSYYTPEDVKRFVAKAKSLNIDVIPEINSPGHMNIWLENAPQYQLVDKNGGYHPDQLDISNPKARAFIKKLIDEYDGAFDSKFWHMGADEYTMTGGYQLYPQLTKYAQDAFGPSANANDAFTAFINEINTYVKGKGKNLRIFNDGLYDTANVQLDKDIVIDYWFKKGGTLTPQQLAERGYQLTNVPQAMYWSRAFDPAGYTYAMKPNNLYNNKNWNVGTFDGGAQIDPNYDKLLGARVSLWPDNINETENEVQMITADSLRFLAQMTWSASRPWPKWEGADGMKATIDSLGDPTTRSKVQAAMVPDGVYGLPELDPVAKGPWKLAKTYDGYYQISNATTGQCLAMSEGKKHLGAVSEVGAQPTLVSCRPLSETYKNAFAAGRERNQQKWQVVVEADNKVSLRNAVSIQYLAVADGSEKHVDIQGVSAAEVKADATLLEKSLSRTGNNLAAGRVAQFPKDLVATKGKLADKSLFSLVREKSITVDQPEIKDVNPSEPREVTVAVSAADNAKVAPSEIKATVSEGWKVLPETVQIGELPARGTGTAKFKLVNTTGTTGSATFTWKMGDEELSTTVNLSGMLGPRVCDGFTDLSADSEEKTGEGAINGHVKAAFDGVDESGKSNTFWHSKWNGGTDPLPHWLVFSPQQALTNPDGTINKMLSVEYLSRQGKVNGRIKSYQIYTSDTTKDGNATTGWTLQKEGQWENGTDWQRAYYDNPAKAKYVKLLITDVWDEVAGREDQFASAAAICVSSQMPPATLTAPAQPENPISVSPAVKVQNAPANPWPAADPAAPAATIAAIADQSLQLGAAIKDIPVKVANGTVREVKGLPAGVVFDKQTGVISGKPAKAGKYSVQVIAENPDEEEVTAAFTITVTEENTPGDTGKPGGSDKPGDTGKPGTSDKPAPGGNASGDGKGKAPGSAAPAGNGNGQASSPGLEGTGSNAAIMLGAALLLIAAGTVAIKRRRL